MIRSFTVTNPYGKSLTMELEKPDVSGFFVVGMRGLGPPKADINMTSRAGSDGSVYTSAKVESRNIVITIVYSDKNVEESRHKIYEFFPIKKQITLSFVTDTRTAHINGYVESNEVELFTSREGSQISILCNDPWFIGDDVDYGSQRLSNVDALFSFPVGFVPYGGTVEFSKVRTIITGSIDYRGDLDAGITMTIRVNEATGNITISNMDTRERLIIYSDVVRRITGTPITAGDEIVITTHTGKKTVRLFRNGVYKNIISAVDKTSNWLKLTKGINNLACTPTTGSVEVIIDSDVLYEGI